MDTDFSHPFRDCFRRRVGQNSGATRKFLPAFLLLALGVVVSAPAAAFREFYVSPAGNAANPGTKNQPFKTLLPARAAVRRVNRAMTGDIVVNLRGGNYFTAAPLEFTAEDSGRNGFQISYRACQKEIPVISGGVMVTNWKPDHGRIFKATLDSDKKLRALFVNGARGDDAARSARAGELGGIYGGWQRAVGRAAGENFGRNKIRRGGSSGADEST